MNDDVDYDLRLYVAGQAPRSLLAAANLRTYCESHLAGRYRIVIVDLLEEPSVARVDGIIAVPTLVRRKPEPSRKIVGDLSDAEALHAGLQVVGPIS